MSLSKRVLKLEEKTDPDKHSLTWKEFIEAKEGKDIPGWEEFIRERTEGSNHESEPKQES